jgi:hypothetical protein
MKLADALCLSRNVWWKFAKCPRSISHILRCFSAVFLTEYSFEDEDKHDTADAHDEQYFRGDLIDGVHKEWVMYL